MSAAAKALIRLAGIACILMGSSGTLFASMEPSFQGLGDLLEDPYGIPGTRVGGISPDGTVVVGMSYNGYGYQAFRWEDGTMTGLDYLPGGGHESFAYDASGYGGALMVGASDSTAGTQATAWWMDGTVIAMGDFPGGSFDSAAFAISADTRYIVGRGTSAMGTEAFRFRSSMQGLGDLPGGEFYSETLAVSADGRVVVGQSNSAMGTEAFVWANGEMTGLGDLPGGEFHSEALAISADGTTVVGYGKSALGTEAFIWRDGIMTSLGSLPGGDFGSVTYEVSADGSIVVGSSHGAPFIWDAVNGMRNLRDILADDLGVDLQGWYLNGARGISDDGLTIVGHGVPPAPSQGGWIATLPEPTTFLFLTAGGLIVVQSRRRQ